MKPVRLEILLDNKTGAGFNSLDKSVNDSTKNFKIKIENQKSFIKDLERQIRSVEREISRASSDSQKKKLIPSLLEAERELKSAKSALTSLEVASKKSGAGMVSLRTQMQNLRNKMADMTEGTEEYAAAMAKLGRMQDRYDDITRQGRIHGDDYKHIRATADAVSMLSGAMSAGVGVASLFGAQEEELARIQTKLQSVMAVTIGLQQVSQSLNKDSYFSHIILAGAKRKWAAAQTLLNTQLGIGVGLSKALMVGGIGLLIAGIASLVSLYGKWKKKQEEINAIKQAYIDIEIDTAKEMANSKLEAEQLHRIASDSNKSLEVRNSAVKRLNALMPTYNGYINSEGVLISNATDSLKNYIAALYKAEKAKKIFSKMEEIDVEMKKAEETPVEEATFWQKAMAVFASSNDQSGTLTYAGILEDVEERNKGKKEELIQELKAQKKELNEELDKLIDDTSVVEALFGDGKKNVSGSSAPESKLMEQRLAAIRRIKEQEIALMREGEQKRKAQAQLEYENKIEEIKREKAAREKHISELGKAGVAVSSQEKEEVGKQALAEAVNAKKLYNEQVKQIDEETARHYATIQREIKLNFASRLEQQLADIDDYYNKMRKEAEGNAALIAQIETARTQAKTNANNSYDLEELDFAEQLELQKLEIEMQGLNMTEVIEQRRNAIIIRYAQQRIALLKSLGDEQSMQEVAQLQNVIAALEKQNSKQKSLKSLVDEKAIAALTKHFVKLGDSQEVAGKKAAKFFTEFQGKMQLASEVGGAMQDLFGGMNEDLDAALGAVTNVAQGFATGGIAGGIKAGAEELLKAGVKWVTAKKEIDEQTIRQYENYLAGMNELIDKQISMLDQLGGNDFGQNIIKTVKDINESIRASRALFGEAMGAGSGFFSHSDGYKANKMLRGYRTQLYRVGIRTTDLNRMTNEQLIKLKQLPEVYAKLSDGLRKYIDDLAASTEKLEEFSLQVQQTVLGFDFTEITSMIVDSITDSSIDNALDGLVNNVNGAIAKMVKNMLARQMLIEPVRKMVESLFKSMDKGGGKYELDVSAAKLFTNGVKELGEQYEREFNKLKAQFAAAGIDFDTTVSAGGRTAVAKGIAQASQDSVDENNARLTNIQGRLMDIAADVKDMAANFLKIFNPISRIADNTDRLINIEREISGVNEKFEKINREGIYLKK